MRDIARLQRNSIYMDSMDNGKGSVSKLPIILCAIVGILIGGLVYKLINSDINIKKLEFQGQTVVGVQEESNDPFSTAKDVLFNIFGMDRYNPITIVTSNSPYFKQFFKSDYLDYVAQKEQEELQKEIISSQEVQTEIGSIDPIASNETHIDNPNQEPTEGGYKEASSSITFEDDDYDRENTPVITNGKIKVVNETGYTIDIDKLLKEPLKLNQGKKGPQIFIYHTHTTESYVSNLSQVKDKSIPSRTMNSKLNVTSVGDALKANLMKYNINTLHNSTVHDADYNQSYVKSLATLEKYVNKYPALKMTIDLHRDAAGDSKLRVVKNVKGKNVAQIMFVIGTDSKLSNPKWRENLKLALKIQSRLNEICPGIAKPTYISQNRYNQHLTNGSVIVEIGGDGNVIDECKRSTAYLAQAINDVVNKNK